MPLRRPILLTATALLLLSACAKQSGQSQYQASEVGKSRLVEFGTIVAVRDIGITGKNSGTGTLLGAGVGAGAGSYAGGGSGQLWTTLGGAVIGAAAGAASEQALADRKGIEYTIFTEKEKTITVPQNLNKEDAVLTPGQRVMVQTSGSYQRVLPADALPTQMKRPKGIKAVD